MIPALSAPPPAEETSSDTRCRILATAERFFREIGYQKTTVADIAKTLRMSPANVYRFFDSKKAINEAVVARIIGEVEARIAAIADRPGIAAEARLREIIVFLHRDAVGRFTGHPRMHEMIEAAMSESWNVCRHHVDRITAVLERVIADGAAKGEFAAEDPAVAARCVHTAIVRFCHPVLVVQCPEDFVPALDAMIAFLMGALRAGPRVA
ncbi:TetR/AcrR family transcriptional regulator [Methylobacterium platani]|uniref:TetR family transcriptional regulator n=2 Tax=Methylobacterium platani TaxID=427683 RepID=A0A179RYD4_9HYPH|nr:TetR/AcrR family transcriptional regulator [Methylobacterium platani]KMO15364.1 TetR family transcriptional regulator [Methylobacterium platani JCM 14648]OAS15979.1 TetR family transcriptional regulator [Methylobacterium platani]